MQGEGVRDRGKTVSLDRHGLLWVSSVQQLHTNGFGGFGLCAAIGVGGLRLSRELLSIAADLGFRVYEFWSRV